MEVVADLFEALPELHCTEYFARDEQGNPVHPLDPKAICWCLLGALYAALDIDEPYGEDATLARAIADQASQRLYDARAADVNNTFGRAGAVSVLRAAAGNDGPAREW